MSRELLLHRRYLRDTYTIGTLSVDGVYFCETLEDKVRDFNKDGDLLDDGEQKIYGETAIPYGRYKVIITNSPKFKRKLPLLVNVPHFEGIRIHGANWATQLEGCIGVGENKVKGGLVNCKIYVDEITNWIEMWQKNGEETFITIV